MRVMRIDNTVAYVVTGIFVLATLVVGAELLYSTSVAIETGDAGLLDLGVVLQDRYGQWAGKLFLARLLGGRDVVPGRCVERRQPDVRRLHDQRARRRSDDADARAGGKWYRSYILWLTFPPMAMMFLGKPVWLILAYGVLGAFFMPFLAVTLLWLLNTDRTPAEWRNKLHSNVLMAIIALAFVALCVNEVRKAIDGA